jgi:5'-3' exonuclease
MGIKHFFSWFRRHEGLKKSISSSVPNDVDHLLIDMNGVIHEAAQRVFKYGKYAPQKPGIIIPRRRRKPKPSDTSDATNKPSVKDLYACVKSEVNAIVSVANPKKTVFLAIDGVAPMSKQNQQRQRRFRAAKEREGKEDGTFDSTCITAGTTFMWELSQYLFEDKWLRSKNPVRIIISDDSKPGEGEHKLMDWIRHNDDTESDVYCVAGMDADLILLCCVLPKTHVYIMREDDRTGTKRYDYIDINRVRQDLPVRADDLLIWSCFIGNDFLPPIPSLEIKESAPETGAMDFFFENYKRPLVKRESGFLNPNEIIRLLKLVRDREQAIMEARHRDESRAEGDYNKRFPNPLWEGDIVKYRMDFRKQKIEKYYRKPDSFCGYDVVHDFMKTVQWVYLYYTKGIAATQAWNWFFPYQYTLHADVFVEYMEDQPFISYGFEKTKPSHPDEQLLRVIPPVSKYLIPSYLHEHVDRLAEKYTLFKVDKSGKRQEWEATTIVDFVELDIKVRQ